MSTVERSSKAARELTQPGEPTLSSAIHELAQVAGKLPEKVARTGEIRSALERDRRRAGPPGRHVKTNPSSGMLECFRRMQTHEAARYLLLPRMSID
jgi:hypothetical protein